MKKLLFIALIISSSLTISAQKLDFGAGIQFFDLDVFGIQGKALYGFNEKIDVAGTFTFYFHEFLDFGIDFDGQYKLLNVSDKFNLYPIAGINISRASVDIFGISSSDTNVGFNLGAMFDFVLDKYRIYAEPKIIITDGTPFNVSAGILF